MSHGSINTDRMNPRQRGRARWEDDGTDSSVWDRYDTDWCTPVTLADDIDRAERAAVAGARARGEVLPSYLLSYGADVDALEAETRAARLARCDAADAADTDRR